MFKRKIKMVKINKTVQDKSVNLLRNRNEVWVAGDSDNSNQVRID